MHIVFMVLTLVGMWRLYFQLRPYLQPKPKTPASDWWCPLCDGDHNPMLCPENAGLAIVPQRNTATEQFIADTETYLAERAEYYGTYGQD